MMPLPNKSTPRLRIFMAAMAVLMLTAPLSRATNLVPNGDFEQGVIGWNWYYSSALASSETNPANVHGGSGSMEVYKRGAYNGASYTGTPAPANGQGDRSIFMNALQASGSGSYVFKAWVKFVSGNQTAQMSLRVKTGGVWGATSTASAAAGTAWTLVTGTYNLSWTGALEDVELKVVTSNTVAFYIDDVSMEKVGSPADPAAATKAAYDTTLVENWRDGATAACSLTCDDGNSTQIPNFLPLLNTYGFKATFFLYKTVLDKYGPAVTTWLPLYQDGHEIGSHSMTHNSETLMDEATARYEVGDSKTWLMSSLGLPDVYSFATPFSNGKTSPYQPLSILPDYYLGSRGATYVPSDPAGEGIVPLLNNDYFALSQFGWVMEPTRNANYNPAYPWLLGRETAADGNAWIDRAIAKRGWAIELIHGVHLVDPVVTATTYSTNKAVYDTHLSYLKTKHDAGDLWVAPMGEVLRYDRERKASSISQTAPTGTQFTVTLATGTPFFRSFAPVPLTVSFAIPAGWPGIRVLDGAASLPVSIRGGRAYVNVVPSIGGSKALTARVVFSNFAEWQAFHFSAAQLADPSISGPAADPLSDKLTNKLKFALGRGPWEQFPPVSHTDPLPDGRPAFVFSRRPDAAGIGLQIQVSTDLVNWSSSPAAYEASTIATGSDIETIRVSPPPGSVPPRWFVRIICPLN